MARKLKHKIGLSLFIITGIITWWSITSNYNADEHMPQAETKRYVELFMNEFELRSMDESGKPSYRMTGDHLQRYNDSNITEVTKPVLHILQQEKQWRVSADSAFFNSKDDTINLKNNVFMIQKNAIPAMTMRTQKMLIHTKTQIAQTKDKVTIKQGESILHANGMIYNNMTSELELLSEVNGFYTRNNISDE